jgi:hypothetical protein
VIDFSHVPVVDGHCHPLLPDPWEVSIAAFLDRFSEGRPGTMASHVPHTGYFMRALRDLAEWLGCAPTIESVLEHRRILGIAGARPLLVQHRVEALLVDTGYPPEAMSLEAMRRALECSIHEVFRIETCAQRLVLQGLAYEDFLDAFRTELRRAAERAVALKSIIAYRSGLAVCRWPRDEVAGGYGRIAAHARAAGSVRLVDKPVLDTLFHIALDVCQETGRPLQVHAGFGDPDVDLPQANPALLRSVLEEPGRSGARIVILHMAYPYFRDAAYMAAVWPQVSVDLSLALPFLGPGASPVLVEMLSLAPSSKLLYGSDLGGLPELFALSAQWGRAALAEALRWLIERGGISEGQAMTIGSAVLADNARALYQLPA